MVNPDNIPDELKQLIQWCGWRYEYRYNNRTKVPIDPRSKLVRKYAKSNDRSTWCSFDEAYDSYIGGNGLYDGIGFFFSEKDPFCGIDLDDPGDDTEARERHNTIIEYLDSYTERSPSGRGFHIICRSKVNLQGRRRDGIEIYFSGRFFTMTGDVVRHAPTS